MQLIRYWFEFEGHGFGYGVKAIDRDDALKILRATAFEGELPPISREVENVDLSTLDADHVLPNAWAPTWRGIWFPGGFQRFVERS
jgi:hypothetical protein